MKRKPQHIGVEDYPHDRVTTSIKKGYKKLLHEAAIELNLDISKINRMALEAWFNAHKHLLSDDWRVKYDKVKGQHGNRWSEFL